MRFHLVAVAAAIPAAMAQMNTSMTTATPMYVTMTIDDCDSTTPETMITVTDGVTVTYCPMCEMGSSSMIPHTTVYTTVYEQLCTTGSSWSMTPQVYTVTESCTMATPSWSASSSGYVPPGFTVTEYTCTMCDTTPMAYTVTEPCDCTMDMSAGTPSSTAAEATPTPSGSGSSGGSPSPGSGSGSGSGSPETSAAGGGSPATSAAGGGSGSAATPAPGSNGGGSFPAPYPTTTTVACPGPQCKMQAPSSYRSGASWGNTSGIEPWTGGASTFGIKGIATIALSLCIGALAILL